uniref:Uncharacterized protein n=1 Tax=Oryza meridionalis TaxID=40149 RepID=A0A0E0FA24_9ORYZ
MVCHGHIDVIYSNDGIASAPPPATLAALNLNDYNRIMDINARSLVTLNLDDRVMALNLNISSSMRTMEVVSGFGPTAYSMSKAAIVGMMRMVARQLARDGVRVNAISLHAIPMQLALRRHSGRRPPRSTAWPLHPARRLLRPHARER